MTALSLNVFSTDKEKSKRIIARTNYRRFVTRIRTSQNKASSTKLYCITIHRMWKNYVLKRKKNQNAQVQSKKTQRMRLHIMYLTILTSLTYLNEEETTLTCHMKECTWPLKYMNTLRRCLTI